MTDVFSPDKRSRVMSGIRGEANRSTELRFVCILRENQITGWRRKYKLFGRPDFVFPKLRVAVFVDGCFWHQCPLHATMPVNNHEFWKAKLRANVERDMEVNAVLTQKGWKILRIWEHELVKKNRTALLERILPILVPGKRRCEP